MSDKFCIAIIDYGMGNVKSIENTINHIGNYDIKITSSEEEIIKADCLVLPGVGAFPDAMKMLKTSGLVDLLNREVKVNKKPVLGICLGMQLLFSSSEEVELTQGLDWIPGNVRYMNPGEGYRVPHVGWNDLITQNQHQIFSYLENDKDFYFVHSLYVDCDDKYVLNKFNYGVNMTAAVCNENIVGMQFHPEKSQKVGLMAMKSFFDWAEKYNVEKGVGHA